MQSMKGATSLLGSMNRSMNLPALQRIAMEFEKENDIMDQRQEMMDDAIDDVTGLEDEEESEDVVKEVLDEIGIDLGQAVSLSSGTAGPFSFGRPFTKLLAPDGRDTLRPPKERRSRRSRGGSYRRPCRRRWRVKRRRRSAGAPRQLAAVVPVPATESPLSPGEIGVDALGRRDTRSSRNGASIDLAGARTFLMDTFKH